MKLGQGNMFTGVCLSTGGEGVSASVHAGIYPMELKPPRADTPPGADPPEQTPPGAESPGADPPEQSPPDQTPPRKHQTSAYSQGAVQYASYWNAFLLT